MAIVALAVFLCLSSYGKPYTCHIGFAISKGVEYLSVSDINNRAIVRCDCDSRKRGRILREPMSDKGCVKSARCEGGLERDEIGAVAVYGWIPASRWSNSIREGWHVTFFTIGPFLNLFGYQTLKEVFIDDDCY